MIVSQVQCQGPTCQHKVALHLLFRYRTASPAKNVKRISKDCIHIVNLHTPMQSSCLLNTCTGTHAHAHRHLHTYIHCIGNTSTCTQDIHTCIHIHSHVQGWDYNTTKLYIPVTDKPDHVHVHYTDPPMKTLKTPTVAQNIRDRERAPFTSLVFAIARSTYIHYAMHSRNFSFRGIL